MGSQQIAVIIVGAGPAGMVLSHQLKQSGIEHLVLEKQKPFSAWYGRWQHFSLNTANWMNVLPGGNDDFVSGKPGADRASKQEAIVYFEDYLARTQPPVKEYVEVLKIVRARHGQWRVVTRNQEYTTKHVVICTGENARPRLSPLAAQLPASVFQIHTSEYNNARQLPTRRILVVGSGSSGIQISDDLLRSFDKDKKDPGEIFLALSGNRRFKWFVLGLPIHSWARWLGLFDIRSDAWLGKWIINKSLGAGDPATPPSPARLRQGGVKLRGRLNGFCDGYFIFDQGEPIPAEGLTIIWCTGYAPAFPGILSEHAHALFDRHGRVRHQGGKTIEPGLYFLGLRFQRTLSSHILYGLGRDASALAREIAENVNTQAEPERCV